MDRAEDLAGIGIAVVTWASAAFAGYESVRKLIGHGAPAEDSASSQECRASAISVAELIRLPVLSLYRATTWFPAMPRAAPAMPSPTWLVAR